jgi:hypothetical protein
MLISAAQYSNTCAVQCSAVQCSAVQCSAVKCSAEQFSAVQCSAVQCSAVKCSAVQCSAVQCSAPQYSNTCLALIKENNRNPSCLNSRLYLEMVRLWIGDGQSSKAPTCRPMMSTHHVDPSCLNCYIRRWSIFGLKMANHQRRRQDIKEAAA